MEPGGMRIWDLRNPAWFSDPSSSSLLVAAYRIARVTPADLRPAVTFDVGFAWGLVAHGSVPCRSLAGFRWLVHGDGSVSPLIPDNAAITHTDDGPIALIATPAKIDGRDDEAGAIARLAAAEALVAAICGTNAVALRLCLNEWREAGEPAASTPPLLFPGSNPPPDVSATRLMLLNRSHAAAAGTPLGSRLRLSLRWYQKGLDLERGQGGGVDAFLAYWIAIETLSMPSTTNIGPVLSRLSALYSINLGDVGARFHVGRIYGLRNRIVHEGHIVAIHAVVLLAVEALYQDLLFDTLSLPHEARLATVWATFDVLPHLSPPATSDLP